jgi:hypothetical protein
MPPLLLSNSYFGSLCHVNGRQCSGTNTYPQALTLDSSITLATTHSFVRIIFAMFGPSHSLSRSKSRSSLWSSVSDPVANYERSLYRYPWLSQDGQDEDLLPFGPRQPSTILPSLEDHGEPSKQSDHDMQNRYNAALGNNGLYSLVECADDSDQEPSGEFDRIDASSAAESLSDTDEDPNLVSSRITLRS